MSVRRRLEDVQILQANGRLDGALLSTCVAIAATSRKRYPTTHIKTDYEAFTKFLGEEMRVVTAGTIQNIYARCKSERRQYDNDEMPLQDILYEFVRCKLAHEGVIGENVEFLDNNELTIAVDGSKVTLGGAIVKRLPRVVQFAPENALEFPEFSKMPPEVVAWVLFEERRGNEAAYIEQRLHRLESILRAAGKS